MRRSPCVQEAQRTSPKKRRILSRYGDYSIFLLGLAHVYLSNQRHLYPRSLVFLFSSPPLNRHVAATVLPVSSFHGHPVTHESEYESQIRGHASEIQLCGMYLWIIPSHAPSAQIPIPHFVARVLQASLKPRIRICHTGLLNLDQLPG